MLSSSKSILLHNATLGDSAAGREVDSILLSGGCIRWLGQRDDAPAADTMIDAQGLRVVPGLTDAHAHLFMRAQELQGLNLGRHTKSIADLLAKLGTTCTAASPDEWIVSADYSEQFLREKRHPTIEELDAISRGRPVLLRRTGGHLSVANSAAMERAGFDSETPDPPGGTLERRDGRLTGVLTESAADRVAALIPPPSHDATVRTIRSVADQCLAYGIVAAVEAAVGFNNGFETEWEIWSRLQDAGDFPLRMGFMLRIDSETATRHRLTPSAVDPMWQVRTLKFFVDGIIGARTAAFFQPYADSDSCGLFMDPPADLRRMVEAAHIEGWQLAAHVIGDRAIDTWLTCLESASRTKPRPEARHRLEHFAVPLADACQRVRALGAIVVPQYAFLRHLGASFKDAIGPARAELLYPGRTVLDAGIPIAGSSDHPIGPLSPFRGMATAIDRTGDNGQTFNASEALSAREALFAYTKGGAYAMHHETFRGQLAVGHRADIAILDRDILAQDCAEIGTTCSRMTIVNGRIAYTDGSLC